MSNYDVLNQPYRICNVEIKNRFTVIPMTMGGLAYDEQGGFSIAQGVQLQFVVGCQFPKLLNIKGRKARTAANQDAFCGLA